MKLRQKNFKWSIFCIQADYSGLKIRQSEQNQKIKFFVARNGQVYLSCVHVLINIILCDAYTFHVIQR